MTLFIIHFFDLLFSGCLSAIMLVIWLRSGQFLSYIEYLDIHQAFTKTYENKLPWLGILILLLTLGLAVFQNNSASIYLVLSVILLLCAEIITRKYMQPLHKQIMRWSKERMPNRWEYVRYSWLNFHIARTILTFLGFLLIVFYSLKDTLY